MIMGEDLVFNNRLGVSRGKLERLLGTTMVVHHRDDLFMLKLAIDFLYKGK